MSRWLADKNPQKKGSLWLRLFAHNNQTSMAIDGDNSHASSIIKNKPLS